MTDIKSIKMLQNELMIDAARSHQAITFLSPGDGDSFDDEEQDDWSDVDDEDFEDMAEDENDLHEIELENDIFDPEDDDHLPPEEDF